MFILTAIASALFTTTVINIMVTLVAWKRGKDASGRLFALGMTAITLWTLSAALDYAAVPLDLKVFFAKLEAVGYHSAFALFAAFSIHYAGNQLWLKSIWGRALLIGNPLFNILLTATNELHGWIWSGFVREDNNIVVFESGPAFSWVILTSYGLIILIFLNVWMAFRKGSEFARRQARILMFALLFPVAINLLYRLGVGHVRGVDWTSITFSITSLLIIYALYGMKFLDIAPVARDKLVDNLSDAMFVLDLKNRIVDINREAANILGTTPAFLIGRDLTEALPLARSFLERPPEREVKDEFFIDLADKRYFDVLLSPVRDERQKLVGRLIIARDITERKWNELRLLQLTQAVEQSPVSVVITDPNGHIVYVNPRFLDLSGFSLEEVQGKTPRIVKSDHTPPEIFKELWETIKSGKTWRGELLNKKKNGELYWELEVISPVFDHAGHTINFIAVKEDVTARKEAEARLLEVNRKLEERLKDIEGLQVILREQVIRDPLTGLYNRHFLNEALGRELARAKREEYPICFLLMDLDNFKKINDTYGHAAGDITIQNFSNILKKQTRAGDIVCRYGGEEFLLVLPNTDISAAAEIAERLRRDFENSAISFAGFQINATTSCGISEFPSDGETEEKVLAAADLALYAAKERGRNRVVIWTEIST